MKKLFQGLKADIKFRGAGSGRKLTDEARELPENAVKERPPTRKAPPGDAQIAAASAAIARLDSKQAKGKTPHRDTIHTQAKDVEVTQEVNGVSNKKKTGTEKGSTYNIMFRCPLTGEILRREDIESHIKKSIEMLSTVDPISASIMKIHTFNKDGDKVKLGVETIAKYLKNIIANPNEKKYQQIKQTNKVFQEKVICLEGAHDFFEAVGFEKKSLTLQEQAYIQSIVGDKDMMAAKQITAAARDLTLHQTIPIQYTGFELQEEFYILSSNAPDQLKDLQSYHDSLLSGKPLIATLDRQPQFFVPSLQAAKFDLPDEYYNLTTEEVRLEQKLRTDKIKQESMLKTKAMREREEKQEIRKYKYTVLRIRFPDDYILQGLFYAQERLSVLVDFIRQHLQKDWLPFELITPCGQKLDDEQATFSQCGLVPSAFLIFRWDEEILADMEASDGYKTESVLKEEFLSSAISLT